MNLGLLEKTFLGWEINPEEGIEFENTEMIGENNHEETCDLYRASVTKSPWEASAALRGAALSGGFQLDCGRASHPSVSSVILHRPSCWAVGAQRPTRYPSYRLALVSCESLVFLWGLCTSTRLRLCFPSPSFPFSLHRLHDAGHRICPQ